MAGLADRAKAPLSLAGAYWLVQRLLGASGVHRHLVTEHARVRASERVLDIGCGTGRLLDVLPECDYTGFDPSAEYIGAAERRYGARGTFRRAGIEDVQLGAARFDVVFAVGVLHHLDDDRAGDLMRLAAGSLGPGGRLVTLDPGLTPGQPKVARWLAERDRGEHVRAPQAYRSIAQRRFAEVTETTHQGLAVLPYTHVVLACRLDGSAQPVILPST